jgi:hypothetical protein
VLAVDMYMDAVLTDRILFLDAFHVHNRKRCHHGTPFFCGPRSWRRARGSLGMPRQRLKPRRGTCVHHYSAIAWSGANVPKSEADYTPLKGTADDIESHCSHSYAKRHLLYRVTVDMRQHCTDGSFRFCRWRAHREALSEDSGPEARSTHGQSFALQVFYAILQPIAGALSANCCRTIITTRYSKSAQVVQSALSLTLRTVPL